MQQAPTYDLMSTTVHLNRIGVDWVNIDEGTDDTGFIECLM